MGESCEGVRVVGEGCEAVRLVGEGVSSLLFRWTSKCLHSRSVSRQPDAGGAASAPG